MTKLLYIDLFCGAGGTSTGVENATFKGYQCAKVIACVNHDANAIASHAANHPDALHFVEDIRTLELSPMIKHVEKCRLMYPGAKIVMWASCECTNFSKAKGGQPRDADSRTLPEHLFRYIEAIDPDYIQLENVEEFMCWGDLDDNGKPIDKYNGRLYLKWANHIKNYGYEYEWKILNAADYGAYTSRKRFFGIFAKHGLPISFPVPTFSKNGDSGLFNEYKKWKAVKEVLDLKDEGSSIFSRSKPLVEKTLDRIYAGLIKFVAGGKYEFLSRYNSVKPKDTAMSIDKPVGVITTNNRYAKVKVNFLSKQFSGDNYSKNISIDGPSGSITTVDHHAFITAYYGNGSNHSLKSPCPTITTSDRFGLISPKWIDMQYGNGTPSSINRHSPVVATNPKQSLITSKFLVNPQFNSKGSSVNNPCFTLIARMDKMPPYLVSTENGIGIKIYESDSPMTVKIKQFMAMYGIVDIKMRMLKISELKKIMGFPEDYVLIGSQADQKKFIGNAVEVNMARVLCEALVSKLQVNKLITA